MIVSRRILCMMVAIFLASTVLYGAAPTPTRDYKMETISGFRVLVHPDVDRHAEEAAQMRAELKHQLDEIRRVVPAGPLKKIASVPIWVEWETKPNGAAEFHPSAEWLKDNGYNVEKAGAVELNNCRNFVRWSQEAQPWMVLHELAHAYHHLTLGVEDPRVEAAYKQAMERKLYDSVDFVTGGKRKAYSTTNSKEYFAEISEAWFGKNDFAPFTREELKTHDPVGYQLMQDVWK